MSSEEALLDASERGEVDEVQALLDEGKVDVNAADPEGNSALHLAVQKGELPIATLLLEADCDVDQQNALGETALLLAARGGDLEAVQLLLQYGADKRIEDDNGRTPFFVAMSATHAEVAAELLPGERASLEGSTDASGSFFGRTDAAGNGTGATSEEKRLETAKREDEQQLRDAAEAGDIVGVKEILKLSPEIDIDALDDQGHTALYRAVFYGRTQVVEYLLKQGADADMRDRDGKTPLHVAASRGYGKIMRLLLGATENMNVQDVLGATPLFSAAESGSTDVLKALLDYGADVNIPNNNEETPLWVATANGHSAYVKVLLESDSNGNVLDVDSPGVLRGQTPLHLAAERGNTRIAGLLLEHGADKDVRDASGCTPLFIAADMGRSRMVAFLLEKGAALDAVNQHGETALFVAAVDGHVPVTQELLSHKADTEAADVNGQTPLMGAAQEGHTAIISELLLASAKIEAANNIGETPLMIAALEGYQNAVAFLIENGADIDTARNDGKTALHMAAMDGHTGTVNVLLAAAEAEFRDMLENPSKTLLIASPLHLATDTLGETALHSATRFRQVSVMKLLLEYDVFFHEALMRTSIYGRLVAVPNKFGWTALHSAVDRAHQGAVRLLLERDANVNASDTFGNTPIHLAARGTDHRILLDLLSVKGAHSEAVNVDGRSPLHFASACVRPSSVTFLLNAGADVSAADVYKKEPLDVLGSVDVCNPPAAEKKGLCNFAKHRPDMCPITLGTKNALVETEVMLQVAKQNQNETDPCYPHCNKPPQSRNDFPQNQRSGASSIVTSADSSSVRVPVYGLLIPALFLLLLFAIGMLYFIWRQWFRNNGENAPQRHSFRFSKRRLKEKQQRAEHDQNDPSTPAHQHIARKNTFEMMKSILAEPPGSHLNAASSRSDSSDSDGSCGWSDDTNDQDALDLNGCSSGEPPHEVIVRPRGTLFHNDSAETDYLSKASLWSPPTRTASVPRLRPKDCPRTSFIIRMKEEDPTPQEQVQESAPSPERVLSLPIL